MIRIHHNIAIILHFTLHLIGDYGVFIQMEHFDILAVFCGFSGFSSSFLTTFCLPIFAVLVFCFNLRFCFSYRCSIFFLTSSTRISPSLPRFTSASLPRETISETALPISASFPRLLSATVSYFLLCGGLWSCSMYLSMRALLAFSCASSLRLNSFSM